MDEFLSDIYTEVFKEWILTMKSNQYRVGLKKDNHNIVVITTPYSYTEVIFNDLNIIEFSVTNKINDKVEFYLHFQMKTLKHAMELFEEMLETVHQFVYKPKMKVLLSCTGGLTTGYFAEKLNEANEMLALDYEFDAVAYGDLYEAATEKYEMILLAPQIAYLQPKIQEILHDKTVVRIPSGIFAKYDVISLLQLIQREKLRKNTSHTLPTRKVSPRRKVNNKHKILSISMIRPSQKVSLYYRIYDESNHIILDNEVIKNRISIDDICDILDIVFVSYPDIEYIGLSMPGIVNEGRLVLRSEGFDNSDIVGMLKSRYNKTFVLVNDVNAIAVGYYASSEKYSTFSFLFQPQGSYSGIGNIVNGELIEGRRGIAGEAQYLPFYREKDALDRVKTPETIVDIVAKTMASIICVLGVEAIVLSCPLIFNKEDVVKELVKYLPFEYIPDIICIDNLNEYNLLGTMMLCSKAIEDHNDA